MSSDDGSELLRSYAGGPRIWDAASVLPGVYALAEKGLIEPASDRGPYSSAYQLTEAGRREIQRLDGYAEVEVAGIHGDSLKVAIGSGLSIAEADTHVVARVYGSHGGYRAAFAVDGGLFAQFCRDYLEEHARYAPETAAGTVRVKFYGDHFGGHKGPVTVLDVADIADGYARGKDGTCAYCNGDPLGEKPCEACGGGYFEWGKDSCVSAGGQRYTAHAQGCAQGQRLIEREILAVPGYSSFETCPCCRGRAT